MIEYHIERDIAAPRDQVFSRLVDLPGYESWLPSESRSTGCQLTSDGPIGLGTTYVDQTATGPMQGEIVEFDPPRRVVYVQGVMIDDQKVFEARQTNTLEETDTGTRLTHEFAGRFFEPYLDLEPPRDDGEGERGVVFDALKAACEG